MAISVNFSTNNSAFGDPDSPEFGEEVARILEEAAEKFRAGYAAFPLRDINGNTVGRAGLVTEDN